MAKVGAQAWRATHPHQHSITTKDLCGTSADVGVVEQLPLERTASVCPVDQIAEAMIMECSRILRASSRRTSRRHRGSSSFENPLRHIRKQDMV